MKDRLYGSSRRNCLGLRLSSSKFHFIFILFDSSVTLLLFDPLTLVEFSIGSAVAGGAGAILTSFDLGPRGFTALLLLLLLLGGEETN